METSFLVILLFLLLQRFGLCSNTMMLTSSSNVTCTEWERRSLFAIKESLEDKYNLLSTWRGLECCQWKGVGCDTRNGHVVKLDLRSPMPWQFYIRKLESKVLGGKLSPHLQNLKHLRYLDLSTNNFSGNIPEFLGLFQHLEYLNLSFSGLSGVVPRHLGNLSRLQYLDLRNYFEIYYHNYEPVIVEPRFGETTIIDDLGWVSSLSSLRYLDLSGITIGKHIDWFHPINMLPSLITLNLALSGITNIPSVKFVNFTSLNSLDLSSNYINSTIPMWFSNLTNLMHLNLNDNQFHGEIPDFLGMFSNLVSIDLYDNSFDTSMPGVLCNLSSLVHLDLSYNTFSGPVPTSLGQLLRLEDLYLQHNQLSGNIPMSLGQLSNLKNVHLSENRLVGVVSETHFERLTNLNNLGLSSNQLAFKISSRWVPPFQLQTFYASSCNLGPGFPNWLQTQTTLRRLDLSKCSIRDTIPEWFEKIMSHVIYGDGSNHTKDQKMNSIKFEGSFATLPSEMTHLDLSDNLLSGHFPVTDRTIKPGIKVLKLSRNRFTGSIPAQLCTVDSIVALDLSQNKFSGRLPGCLGNLTNLVVMDLANNTITGIVPSSLGSLNSLTTLHLQNNTFEGDIPLSLQNLTKLVAMDLGSNLFTGNIPSWIGEKLSSLRILDLHNNMFTGLIPLEICQLGNLKYLNLANNSIIGVIPRCFGNLSSMRTTNFRKYYEIYTSFYKYEVNILASMKGRELLYTKTITFFISLDLSNNNIVGEIPDALMNLVGLKSLNLSRNLLQGQIPMAIGNLKQLESLDLSINKLSGRIPQSLTNLNFLSYMNLSFNGLYGPIPTGNQLQTLDDSSIYEGNKGLCGPAVSRSCNGNDTSYDHVDEDEGKDDNGRLWFYAGMGPGFAVGLLGLLGSLHFIRSWRVAYFEMLENIYGWLMVSIQVNLARLRRKYFE